MEESFVDYPFGEADSFSPTIADTIEVKVKKRASIINLGTLGQAVTVNLSLHKELKIGATLMVVAKSDGTARNVVLGTGFVGPDIAGTISKTKSQFFQFDGANFIATAAAITLD